VHILLVGEGLFEKPFVAVVIKVAILLEKEAWQVMLVAVTLVTTELVSRFVQVAGVNPQV
jgi:hypothetical protein